MGNVYEESREESFGRDGVQVTRTLRVEPYSYVDTVLEALLGRVELIGDTLVRILPHQDPYRRECFCDDVKVTPVEILNSPGHSNAGLAILEARNYSQSARLVCTYKTLDTTQGQQTHPPGTEQQEKELASESYDFGARNLTLPGQYMVMEDGTDTVLLPKEGLQATKTIPTVEYQLVRHYVPRVPADAIVKLCGRINKSVFQVVKRNWPSECVRFDGLHASRKIANRGIPLFELTYKLAIQPVFDVTNDEGITFVGWNRLFRPVKNWWQAPHFVGDANRHIYQWDEDITQTIKGREVKGFSLLFHPGAT